MVEIRSRGTGGRVRRSLTTTTSPPWSLVIGQNAGRFLGEFKRGLAPSFSFAVSRTNTGCRGVPCQVFAKQRLTC